MLEAAAPREPFQRPSATPRHDRSIKTKGHEGQRLWMLWNVRAILDGRSKVTLVSFPQGLKPNEEGIAFGTSKLVP